MDKYLIIYNTETGAIVYRVPFVEDRPITPINGGLLVVVPNNKLLDSIDVSDPENPEPIFVDSPRGYDIDRVVAQTYYTAVMTDTLIEED